MPSLNGDILCENYPFTFTFGSLEGASQISQENGPFDPIYHFQVVARSRGVRTCCWLNRSHMVPRSVYQLFEYLINLSNTRIRISHMEIRGSAQMKTSEFRNDIRAILLWSGVFFNKLLLGWMMASSRRQTVIWIEDERVRWTIYTTIGKR